MSQLLKDCSYRPESVTVGESDGKFVFIPFENEETEHTKLQDVTPSDILIIAPLILKDHSSSFSLPYTNESAFYPIQEHPLKAAWLSWRDKGTMEMLQLLSTQENTTNVPPRVTTMASSLLKCFERWNNLYSTLTFQPRQVNHEAINDGFSPITSWSTSIIRAISVHLHSPLIAICRQDDIIEVRDTISEDPPVSLKDRYQVSVSSLEWASHSNTLLAVGVLGGVVLWYIDITHRNIKHPCTFLPCFESVPVVSLNWCPKGRLLACGTPTDSTLLLWDVPLMSSTKLKRVHGGGVALINWSPSGDWLFVGHVNSLCRVWETRQWTCEKWTNLAGRCKASCWSPKGDYLVFAVENDPSLYYISLKNRQMTLGGSGVSAAVKCADLTECCLGDNEDDPNMWIGGGVQWLSWHNSGKRLAVLFSSSNTGGSKIAVFRTQCFPVLELFSGGIVSGKEDEAPVWVEFADYSIDPALLVTGWDSGRVSFIPFQSQPVGSNLVPEKIGTNLSLLPIHLPVLAPPTSTITPTTAQPPPTIQLYTNQL